MVAFSVLATAWITGRSLGPPADTAEPQAADNSGLAYQHLERKMDVLAAQAGENGRVLTQLLAVIAEQQTQSSAAGIAVTVPDIATSPNSGNPSRTPGEQAATQPDVVFVNPTPQQNLDYETLNSQLDDPVFLESLNLRDFSRSVSLLALPEPLQMLLIQKAIAQYNSGNIQPEVFLGPDAPIYR